ncbi:meiotically up-regulated gene 56 protein [Bimuria novae-zelandiae CBS 107.79]|uniref:Meiotically up-regulated gene 56 protein n=1 Tax=Bimuria novae-zelandiae CBS 107.79 TaxID=1447943 RepID=A0A6A5UN55_9PLEO|nr:meiotically up-regulated gene 56 protein [Bimuria novae-zelandiae CBS 107.79]
MPEQGPHSWHNASEIASLSPDSYTAQRLQHATPDHLHVTSRRFFIGPIPEGWLKTHRRDWYKHHLHINYSSRTATFSSNDRRGSRDRRLSGLEGPSTSALFQHSFPQPEEIEEEDEAGQDGGASGASAGQAQTPPALQIPRGSAQKNDVMSPEEEEFVDAASEPDEDLRVFTHEEEPENGDFDRIGRRQSTKSFVTASSERIPADDDDEAVPFPQEGRTQEEQAQVIGLQVPTASEATVSKSLGKRPLPSPDSTTVAEPSVDAVSTTSLLLKTDSNKASENPTPISPAKNILARVKRKSHQTGSSDSNGGPLDRVGGNLSRTRSNLRHMVQFDIPEDSKRASVHLRAKQAQMTIQRASSKLRRRKIKDGLIVKMERMLIRVDEAGKEVPDDFDENGSQKIDSRVKEKWREYMVVCRHTETDGADFVLQMYKTRVIPEIEEPNASKQAAYQIPLGRKITKVNLYSSLDKSVVVWMPVSRGTRIFIMQARTSSSAVEWYTFLRNVMGWRRADELQINVPDMSVSLRISDPFSRLEASQNEVQESNDSDNEEAILKTMQEEQAVARALISQCLDQLDDSPEWADILDSWVSNQRMGLCWKRYDRLEWIHGANERKMYGTIAMAKSHDLELRPKTHYPTTAVTRKKHKTLTEPVPVEGFLIRLTSQRGRTRRLGLMYHKQLYFATHDNFLIFSRPTHATPPPPPRMPASERSAVPSARTIKEQTPDTWAVDPFPVQDNHIEWLLEGHSGTSETRRLHDEDAADEAQRKLQNLLNCDGYINLANVVKVRKAQMGASLVDEQIESGSEVDFDEEVDDTTRDDGAIKEVNIHRTFELVMRNGLIIRLQAADKERRKDWIKHLRALVKYWKHRTYADISLYKSTRARNLSALNIDEEAEAYVGQFAKKWEVTQSYASPLLYNICGIAECRSIHMSGTLYRKPRIHAPFTRCSVLLAAGTLLIFQDVLRSGTGKQLAHIHHERMANLDLRDCYVYSGLLTESDLLYQNQTFDSNKPGHHALPKIYLEDGWTSTDEDVMTTFVVWYGKSKSWFRAEEGAGEGERERKGGKRTKLKRVAKLGGKGRNVVFRARSRAERDHWVLSIQNAIEKVQGASGEDFRIQESAGAKKNGGRTQTQAQT